MPVWQHQPAHARNLTFDLSTVLIKTSFQFLAGFDNEIRHFPVPMNEKNQMSIMNG